MNDTRHSKILESIRHFQHARWQANMEQVMSRITGSSVDLLSYEETRRLLRANHKQDRGLQDIPLDAIVGSVGRYADFSRSFLPLHDSDRHRWAQVDMKMADMAGLPPIEVYQLGEAYFVQDGNHRVSVARQHEFETIEAYVTELETRVPLSPEVQPDDLILAAEYAEFLAQTRIDELFPEVDLQVTVPGRYREILEQIEVQQHYMEEHFQRPVSYEEAVKFWYDEVYAPIAELIDERGMLRDFPERTPLDLYVWITKYRLELNDVLGWDIPVDIAAADMSRQRSQTTRRLVSRLGGRLADTLTPDALESGPPSGRWRWERQTSPSRHTLLSNILVPITGQEEHWFALHQALQIARREGSRILGLHVVASEAEHNSPAVDVIRSDFYRLSAGAGVPVHFLVESGKVARVICERAHWTDLTVIRLVYPPATNPLSRLGSGVRTMLRRCSGPLLVVPRIWHTLEEPLLAFNRTDKAREALYLSAYLAEKWEQKLVIQILGETEEEQAAAQEEAQDYLRSQNISASFVPTEGETVDAILDTAAICRRDLIIIGGYSATPLTEMMRDSNVNMLLRRSPLPLLICR